MDLEGIRSAVRSLAASGSIDRDLLDRLPAGDRRALVSLERSARKAGGLGAVTPPAHSAFWMAPARE